VAVEVVRKYKVAILGSWICASLGVGLFALWDQHSSLALKASLQIILGIGTGSLFSILNLPMQASAPHVDDMGLAAGILCSFRLFGGLIGLSMSSTIFNNIFEQRIRSLGSLPSSVASLSHPKEAVGFTTMLSDVSGDLDAQLFSGIIEAYRKAMIAIFLDASRYGSAWACGLDFDQRDLT
jgi:hypothetical protein